MGESLALNFLLKRKYILISQNLSFEALEVDLIVFDQKRQELVFVEVKTRSNNLFFNPAATINWRKKLKMKIVANQYLKKHPNFTALRFDLMVILNKKVHHYQNVFE